MAYIAPRSLEKSGCIVTVLQSADSDLYSNNTDMDFTPSLTFHVTHWCLIALHLLWSCSMLYTIPNSSVCTVGLIKILISTF